MKDRFIKSAKELGFDILTYESFRVCGCQEYDIQAFNNKGDSVFFREAIEIGASKESKDLLIQLFEEELRNTNYERLN